MKALTESTLGAREGLERAAATDDLEPFQDVFKEAAEAEAEVLESREGGGAWSEKVGASGDCRRDEGTETTTGDETAVATGLLMVAPTVAGAVIVVVVVAVADPPPAGAVGVAVGRAVGVAAAAAAAAMVGRSSTRTDEDLVSLVLLPTEALSRL